ncbi:MAG TPA: 2'-5' RNA ligase family protein [Steroidobacteraceae bacterium]|nr:2'-5' RNA ligase family protein [Steroidobacteraceae bacterium]
MSNRRRNSDSQDQWSLFDGDRASPPMPSIAPKRPAKGKSTDRFFFAIQPDAEAIEKSREIASRLRVDLRLSGNLFPQWRLHVSLTHLGDYVGVPRNILRRAQDIASTIHMHEFRVRFDRITTLGFPGKPSRPKVLVATEEMPGLNLFMGLLYTSIYNVSVAPVFTPHMTLLYDERIIDDITVEPVTWIAREFVLIRNVLGTGRPYEILGRWPLLRIT